MAFLAFKTVISLALLTTGQDFYKPENLRVSMDESGFFIGATVVADRFKPCFSPGGGSCPEPLNWGDTYQFCLPEQQKLNENWYLLVEGAVKSANGDFSFKPVGWVPDWAILRGNKSLLNQDGLQKKAALINSEDSIREDPSRKAVAPYRGPGKTYSQTTPLRFFNYLFVYGEQERDDGSFVLLGTAPVFTPRFEKNRRNVANNGFDSVVRGWFPKVVVLEWDTREAVEYNSDKNRTIPTQYFFSVEDARNYAKNPLGFQRNKKELTERMEKAGDGFMPLPFTAKQPRYPILKEKGKNLNFKDPKPDGPNNLGFLKRIGVIGGFFNPDNPENFVDAANLQEALDKIQKVADSRNKTELLLVIDDTTSMKNWLRTHVPDLIQNAVQAINNNNQEIILSVVFYNDLENEDDLKKPDADLSKAVDCSLGTTRFSKKTSPKEICDKIRERKPNGGGGGPREQVFHGIKLGLEMAARQSDPLSRKICVVIGDYANHQNKKNEKDIEEIAELLVPINKENDSIAWEFLALQTPWPQNNIQNGIQPSKDYIDFHEQMDAIAKSASKRWLTSVNERDARMKIKRKTDRSNEALEMFKAISGLNPKIRNDLKAIENISTRYKAIADQTREDEKAIREFILSGLGGTEISDSLRDALAAKGIDVNILSGNGAQIFVPAYAWEKNPKGQNQFKEMVLLDRSSIGQLRDLLAKFKDSDLKNITKKLIDELTDVQAGESDGGKFTDLPKYKGLQFRSPLLQLSLKDKDQIVDKIKAGSEELKTLRLKQILIDEILGKTKGKWVWKKDALNNPNWVQEGESIPVANRFFRFNDTDTQEYIWLDWNEEFP